MSLVAGRRRERRGGTGAESKVGRDMFYFNKVAWPLKSTVPTMTNSEMGSYYGQRPIGCNEPTELIYRFWRVVPGVASRTYKTCLCVQVATSSHDDTTHDGV